MTFLEELQAQTGLLGNQIRQSSPFATYTPTSERTIQGVPQNYFDPATNQFMMPALGQSLHGGTQYTGMGTGMGTGTYTPGVFGEYYGQNIPVVPPTGIISGTTGGPAGGGGSGRTDPVNPTAFDFPNLQTLPGWAGLLTGLFDLPQGTKFKWNPETEQYEPESFVNVPEDIEGEPVSTWNPDKSTMTMDKEGRVTYGTDPYGIGDYTAGTGTGSVAASGSLMGSGMLSDNIVQTMAEPGPTYFGDPATAVLAKRYGRPTYTRSNEVTLAKGKEWGSDQTLSDLVHNKGVADIKAMAEAAQTDPQVLADIAAMTGHMPTMTKTMPTFTGTGFVQDKKQGGNQNGSRGNFGEDTGVGQDAGTMGGTGGRRGGAGLF
tara:strand:- start:984 stop:2108 length:1125 start_codon:yes stop_codon:yes gene_type:complete